jgi:hypothetical protein
LVGQTVQTALCFENSGGFMRPSFEG